MLHDDFNYRIEPLKLLNTNNYFNFRFLFIFFIYIFFSRLFIQFFHLYIPCPYFSLSLSSYLTFYHIFTIRKKNLKYFSLFINIYININLNLKSYFFVSFVYIYIQRESLLTCFCSEQKKKTNEKLLQQKMKENKKK